MKCLIVEDDALVRLDLVQALTDMGYSCEETNSVEGAEYLLKTQDFDLAILDLNVADGNTLAVTDYLFIRDSKTAIILITGTGAYPHGETAQLAPNVDFFLRKPVHLPDLKAIIEHVSQRSP